MTLKRSQSRLLLLESPLVLHSTCVVFVLLLLLLLLLLLILNFVSFSNICSIQAIETKKPFYRTITSLFYASNTLFIYLFIIIGSLLTFCCTE